VIPPRIPFLCPRCGEVSLAPLYGEALAVDPFAPTVFCERCAQPWRVQVYPMRFDAGRWESGDVDDGEATTDAP